VTADIEDRVIVLRFHVGYTPRGLK
jgi:hypothetical protein